MAKKDQLRQTRSGTVINTTSKKQESEVGVALKRVMTTLEKSFSVKFGFAPEWKLKVVVESLRTRFHDVDFHYHFDSSSMRPDGGILSLVDVNGSEYPVLISEVKNQGTNDARTLEGKPKQAKGNAIERLGKNVIGFRTALLHETIFPFVCFGDGCDFADDSSIRDRVTTIAMFGQLNKTYLHAEGSEKSFRRGSFYFRSARWTSQDMYPIMLDIAERSIHYYFSKYGRQIFTTERYA